MKGKFFVFDLGKECRFSCFSRATPCVRVFTYMHIMYTTSIRGSKKKTSRGSEENFCLPCRVYEAYFGFQCKFRKLGGGVSDPLDPRITCMPSLKRNDKQYTNVQKVFLMFSSFVFFGVFFVCLSGFFIPKKKI